jgi:ubiquinone/menaquinone biosynthesis C-methylase UbiE
MLRPITERLLRSAGIEPGMRVLDIGCGAGDVSMLAAELVGSTGSVVGIDRNEIGSPPPLSRRHRTGMRARV